MAISFIIFIAEAVDKNPELPSIMMREVASGGVTLPKLVMKDIASVLMILAGILEEGKKKSLISKIWDQIKDPMIIVLIAAAIISGVFGEIAKVGV